MDCFGILSGIFLYFGCFAAATRGMTDLVCLQILFTPKNLCPKDPFAY